MTFSCSLLLAHERSRASCEGDRPQSVWPFISGSRFSHSSCQKKKGLRRVSRFPATWSLSKVVCVRVSFNCSYLQYLSSVIMRNLDNSYSNTVHAPQLFIWTLWRLFEVNTKIKDRVTTRISEQFVLSQWSRIWTGARRETRWIPINVNYVLCNKSGPMVGQLWEALKQPQGFRWRILKSEWIFCHDGALILKWSCSQFQKTFESRGWDQVNTLSPSALVTGRPHSWSPNKYVAYA